MSEFDKSDFTTAEMLIEMRNSAPAHRLTRGAPGEVREFTAIALVDSVPMGEDAFKAFGGSPEQMREAGAESRYQVICMIIGNSQSEVFDTAINNPHNYAPLCGKNLDNLGIIASKFYLRCFTGRNYMVEDTSYIEKGDELRITVKYNSDGYLYPALGEIKLKTSAGTKAKATHCAASLIKLFEETRVRSTSKLDPKYSAMRDRAGTKTKIGLIGDGHGVRLFPHLQSALEAEGFIVLANISEGGMTFDEATAIISDKKRWPSKINFVIASLGADEAFNMWKYTPSLKDSPTANEAAQTDKIKPFLAEVYDSGATHFRLLYDYNSSLKGSPIAGTDWSSWDDKTNPVKYAQASAFNNASRPLETKISDRAATTIKSGDDHSTALAKYKPWLKFEMYSYIIEHLDSPLAPPSLSKTGYPCDPRKSKRCSPGSPPEEKDVSGGFYYDNSAYKLLADKLAVDHLIPDLVAIQT